MPTCWAAKCLWQLKQATAKGAFVPSAVLLPAPAPSAPAPAPRECSAGGAHLAEAVHDDEDATQEVAAGWIIPHDVFVPQLDGHQGAEQLAQLLNNQVKLSLQDNQASETVVIISKSKEEHLICAGLLFTDHCTVKWCRDLTHEMQLFLQPLSSVPRRDKYPFIPPQGSAEHKQNKSLKYSLDFLLST